MIIGIDDKNMAAGKALLLYQAYTYILTHNIHYSRNG